MYDNSGDSARRLSFSFITVLALHAALLWTLNVSSISQRERGKLITNVELQRYAAPELKAPAPAAPESLAAPALPGGKPAAASFALPVQRPAERQVAIIDQLPAQQQRQTQAAADRLVDKAAPLPVPSRAKLDGFSAQANTRSGGLVEVADTAARSGRQTMGSGMQALTDRQAPMRRSSPAESAASLPEIGRERAAQTVADVAAAPAQTASRPTLADKSRLLEKKEAMRRQLAGLRDESLPGRSEQQIGEVIGTPRGRTAGRDSIAQLPEPAVASSRAPATATARPQVSGMPSGRTVASAAPAAYGGGSGYGAAGSGDGGTAEQKPRSAPDLSGILKKSAAAPAVTEIRQSPVQISGPLEKRKVLSASVPPYPDWAKRRGIEADVSLKFFVTPAGRVTNDVSVLTTSGFIELDMLCIEHIKKWTFIPLSAQEEQQKQWGIITMRFRLE